ncbi:MAG: ATP-binding protein [Nitrospirales bacterium]|nr:GAF domain-containing protein [Nitrospira sp.]MDR4502774.1 ATP-binding protein [Nitrospirales bacterium]
MNFYAFSGLINGFISSGLGLFIFSRAPKNAKHQTYGLYCLSLSIWSYAYYFWHIQNDPDSALFLTRALMAGAILIPITHIQHVVTLLGIQQRHRVLLWFGYVLTGGFLLSDMTTLFVSEVKPIAEFPYWPVPGPAFSLYLAWFIFSIGYAAYLFGSEYRKATGIRRTQYLYLLVGSLAGYLGGATNFPLWYGVPIMPYGTILVSLYVVAVAYTLVRYRMLDFSIAVERSLTFLFLLVALSIPALGVLLYLEQIYLGQVNIQFTVLLLLVASILVALAYRMMEGMQAAVSKALFRERHDMYQALSTFSKSLVTNLKLKPLAHEIVHMLGQVMGIQHVVLFILDKERKEYAPISQFGLTTDIEQIPKPTLNDPLPRHLTASQSLIIRDELEDTADSSSILSSLKATMESMGIDLCLPLINKRRLLGFCVLGPKTSTAAFTSLDIDLLTTLSHEAAIAIDNAMLYEELKRSQALVRRTDRLRSLETMAGGLAHEIRNPLTSIKAFVDLVPERATDESFLLRFGQVVKDDVLRIERLTKEILDYARPAEPFLKLEDVNEIVESCLYALRIRASHQIVVIETDLANGLPAVYVDRQQLKQVFLNLFLNATESMAEKGGTLTVRSSAILQQNGDRRVRVEVRDTGGGIAQEDLEHIFDPFFTTKHHSEEHEGTGLGLAIAHQIIQEHKGHVEVKSELGKGAIFIVDLPAQNRSSPLLEDVLSV